MSVRLFLVAFWPLFLPSAVLFGGGALGGYFLQRHLLIAQPQYVDNALPGCVFLLAGVFGTLIHGTWIYRRNRGLIERVVRPKRDD